MLAPCREGGGTQVLGMAEAELHFEKHAVAFPGLAVSWDQRRGTSEGASAIGGPALGTNKLFLDLHVLLDREYVPEVHTLHEGGEVETRNRDRCSTRKYRVGVEAAMDLLVDYAGQVNDH